MKKMKAVFKVSKESGKKGTEIREVALPEPEEGEVLVKVKATSICGTDRHIYKSDPSIMKSLKVPVIYGHEFCGFIHSFGKNTKSHFFKEGDYVSSEMHKVCGFCYQCRTGRGHICENTKILGVHDDGCFAEYVKVPLSNLVKLPENLKPEIASFLDALGNAVHTIQPVKISGKNVLILGYGPIGAMSASLCEFLEAKKIFITEISDMGINFARTWVKKKNLDERVFVIDVKDKKEEEQVKEIFDLCPEGIDTLLEISGAESALNMGLKTLRRGGEVSLLGIPSRSNLNINDYTNDVIFKGITLYAIIGRRMFETWYQMLDLLQSGLDLSHIPNKIYKGLDNFFDGMEDFVSHKALKAVFMME
ncbi:MAG: alcohol dehydrogenase catalytic domain-containing protein [Thermoanaerobaculia bacterium]